MLGFSAEWFHVYWSKKKTWMKIVHTINIDASCSSYWLGITKILTTWLFVFILSINNSDDGHCYGNFYAFLSWKVIKRPKWLHKIIQMLTVYIMIMIEGRKKFDWCYKSINRWWWISLESQCQFSKMFKMVNSKTAGKIRASNCLYWTMMIISFENHNHDFRKLLSKKPKYFKEKTSHHTKFVLQRLNLGKSSDYVVMFI